MSDCSYQSALVTGGTGLIGSHFLRLLGAKFPQLAVTVATRNSNRAELPVGQSVVFMDLPRSISLQNSVDIVFHIAGEIRNHRTMVEVNYEGTRKLVAWAASHGVKRFVHVSSVAVYGAASGSGFVDERSPMRPKNLYAVSKKMAEDSVKECCKAHGIEYVILQPANVISAQPFKERQLLNFMTLIKRGLFFYLCRDTVTFNYVSAEAVANGLYAAMLPEAANRTFILNTPSDLRCVVAWIAEELGVRHPRVTLPKVLGWFGATVATAVTRVLGVKVPFNYSRYAELTMRTRFAGNAIVDSLGFEYDPSLEVAIRRLAKRYMDEVLL